MKRCLIVATSLVSVISSSALAADWVDIGSSATSSRFFVDKSSYRDVGKDTRVWVKTDDTQNKTVSYRTSVSLYAINCGEHYYSIMSFTTYNPDGTSHDFNRGYGSLPSGYIAPETMAEVIAATVCAVKE